MEEDTLYGWVADIEENIVYDKHAYPYEDDYR